MNDTKQAIEHLRTIVQFAYDQGFHELGYDPVAVLNAALSPSTAQAGAIEIPEGYKAVLVRNEFAPPTPDYDECKRQAEVVTGMPCPNAGWLSIFIREINRWCFQRHDQQVREISEAEKDKQRLDWLDALKVNGYEWHAHEGALRSFFISFAPKGPGFNSAREAIDSAIEQGKDKA